MKQCIARTKSFDRCRNTVEHGSILFCRRHRWWGILSAIAVLVTVTTLLANMTTIAGIPLYSTATPTPSLTHTFTPSPSLTASPTARPVSDYLHYVIVIDASSIMTSSFHGVRTWDVALKTVNDILAKLNPDSHFGLVVIGDSTFPQTEAETDKEGCSKPSEPFLPIADNNRDDIWKRVSRLEPEGEGSFDVAFNTAKDELQGLSPDAIKMLIFIAGANDTCQAVDEWDELEKAVKLLKGVDLYSEIIILDENGAKSQSIVDRINDLAPEQVNAQAPQSIAQVQQVNNTVVNNVTNYISVAINTQQISTAPAITEVAQIATTSIAVIGTPPATITRTSSPTATRTQTPTLPPSPSPTLPPSFVQLVTVEYKTSGIGCQIDVQVNVSNRAATGNFHVWNASFPPAGDTYPTTTLQIGTNWASAFSLNNLITLGGNQPEYYQHEVWFEYNGVQSNRLTGLICPDVPPP